MQTTLCHHKKEEGVTAALQDFQEGISGQIVPWAENTSAALAVKWIAKPAWSYATVKQS